MQTTNVHRCTCPANKSGPLTAVFSCAWHWDYNEPSEKKKLLNNWVKVPPVWVFTHSVQLQVPWRPWTFGGLKMPWLSAAPADLIPALREEKETQVIRFGWTHQVMWNISSLLSPVPAWWSLIPAAGVLVHAAPQNAEIYFLWSGHAVGFWVQGVMGPGPANIVMWFSSQPESPILLCHELTFCGFSGSSLNHRLQESRISSCSSRVSSQNHQSYNKNCYRRDTFESIALGKLTIDLNFYFSSHPSRTMHR